MAYLRTVDGKFYTFNEPRPRKIIDYKGSKILEGEDVPRFVVKPMVEVGGLILPELAPPSDDLIRAMNLLLFRQCIHVYTGGICTI